MATQMIEGNGYAAAFRSLPERVGVREPSWLRRLRESAFEHFERIGFPSVRDEEWKYTNVTPIAKASFEPVLASTATSLSEGDELAPFIYSEARKSRLVFLNGIFQAELSSLDALPSGVVAMDIAGALKMSEYEAAVREQLARYADYEENGFIALNTALFVSGAFVLIPRGLEVKTPIHLIFISEPGSGHAPLAGFPRALIIAQENSSATLIESYVSPNGGIYLTDTVVEVSVGEGARLRHYKLQRESTSAFHVATTKAELGPNASYDATTINFGAVLSRHNPAVRMDNEGAECWIDGLYMVDTGQHTDTHSVIDHMKPKCTSHQLYKGILDGKSRAVFNGKVFVRHGAQQTDAQQTNKNLLLSNEARVDTKPQLEIFADDVKCAHGAAVGQLDEEEIFYLESRGINPELARNLLTYGFAEEVIEKIEIESIKRELDEAVLNRLHSSFEAH